MRTQADHLEQPTIFGVENMSQGALREAGEFWEVSEE